MTLKEAPKHVPLDLAPLLALAAGGYGASHENLVALLKEVKYLRAENDALHVSVKATKEETKLGKPSTPMLSLWTEKDRERRASAAPGFSEDEVLAGITFLKAKARYLAWLIDPISLMGGLDQSAYYSRAQREAEIADDWFLTVLRENTDDRTYRLGCELADVKLELKRLSQEFPDHYDGSVSVVQVPAE